MRVVRGQPCFPPLFTRGDPPQGGDSADVDGLDGGVVSISATRTAFAALHADGSVVAWGDGTAGGNDTAVATQLDGGVASVFGAQRVFAALVTPVSVPSPPPAAEPPR